MQRLSLLLLALAACGDDSSTVQPDASPDIDAPPDAPTGPVRVIAQAGIDVLYLDPSGALIAKETTNSAGEATHDVPAGSSVTLVYPPRGKLNTVLGVEPGDIVRDLVAAPAGQTMTVSFPARQINSYRVSTNCDRVTATTNVVQVQACGARTHVYVEGLLLIGGTSETLYDADVIVSSSHSMSSNTWSPVVKPPVSMTGIPASATDQHLTVQVSGPYGVVTEATTTMATFQPALRDLAGAPFDVEARFTLPSGAQHAYRTRAPFDPAAGAALDVGPRMLPTVTAATWDPTTRVLGWTTDGTGVPPTHALLYLKTNESEWQLFSAHGATTALTFPLLPAGYEQYQPGAPLRYAVYEMRDTRPLSALREVVLAGGAFRPTTAASTDLSAQLFIIEQ